MIFVYNKEHPIESDAKLIILPCGLSTNDGDAGVFGQYAQRYPWVKQNWLTSITGNQLTHGREAVAWANASTMSADWRGFYLWPVRFTWKGSYCYISLRDSLISICNRLAAMIRNQAPNIVTSHYTAPRAEPFCGRKVALIMPDLGSVPTLADVMPDEMLSLYVLPALEQLELVADIDIYMPNMKAAKATEEAAATAAAAAADAAAGSDDDELPPY